MGYVFIVAVLMLILAFILIKNRNKKEAKIESERVELSLTSSYGQVIADGDMDEFTITIDNRWAYLVRNGVIFAYKDSAKSHEFKTYAEVK